MNCISIVIIVLICLSVWQIIWSFKEDRKYTIKRKEYEKRNVLHRISAEGEIDAEAIGKWCWDWFHSKDPEFMPTWQEFYAVAYTAALYYEIHRRQQEEK